MGFLSGLNELVGAPADGDQLHIADASDPTDEDKRIPWSGVKAALTALFNTLYVGLNVYDEGSWTPGLTFGGGSVGMSLSSGGNYRKFWGLIYINGSITVTTKGSSTGNAAIVNMPFARTSGGLMPVRFGSLASNWSNIMAVASGTSLLLLGAPAIANNNTSTAVTHAAIQNGSVLIFEGWYIG